MALTTSAALTVLVFALPLAACQQWVAEEAGSVYSQGYDAASIHTEFVAYEDANGTALQGYLAYSNATDERRGGVVIVPDWDGIGPYEQWRAKLLAQLGYVAFVADVYGADVEQGPSLPMPERGMLTRMYTSNPELYRTRMVAALDQLRAADAVDPQRLAAIGYCFGGTGALELARSWPEGTDGLKGVMGFHTGSLVIGGSPMLPGNPVWVSLQQGADDASIDPADALALQDELSAANATWEYTLYGGAVHAFTEPSLVPGSGNARYSPAADRRSWAALKSFLAAIFGADPYPDTV